MVNLDHLVEPRQADAGCSSARITTRAPSPTRKPNRSNWNKPFVSANDGTSGVAFLMELGHHMKELKCEFGVDFVLFDGEEYVFETNPLGGGDKYFFGSEHFAEEYAKTKDKRKYRYDAGLLLDLFAGEGRAAEVGALLLDWPPKLVEQVWGVAKAVGAKSFKFERGYEVQDDHIAAEPRGHPDHRPHRLRLPALAQALRHAGQGVRGARWPR